MVRAVYVAVFGLLGVGYYYALGPGPTLSDLAEPTWWRPTGSLVGSPALAVLRELSQSENTALRLLPVLLFALPPTALVAVGFALFAGAAARAAALAVGLSCVGFAYYGYLAEDIWRFFSWRWAAASLCLAAFASAFLLAPSLLRSGLRLSRAQLAAALVAASATLYLTSIEVTGTDPALRANLSPWPVLTLFGFLLLGTAIGTLHLAAGAGTWVWSRLTGSRAPLVGVLVAAVIAAVGASVAFPGDTPLAVGGAMAAAAYALVAGVAPADREPLAQKAVVRATAGGLLVAMILLSNWRAETYQAEARDETSARLIAALDAYRALHGSYPDELVELVPDLLPRVPEPRMGLYRHADEVFTYSSFGDSYALEFSSVLWVQCAYTPPYDDAAYYDDDEGVGDEGADDLPDVAAGAADEGFDSLDASWSCESTPPRLF